FSVGTVAGALVGAAMVAFDVPVTAHLLGVAVAIAVLVPVWVRRFLPDAHTTDEHPSEDRHRVFQRWLEPRTLLVGVVVLAFAFSEGTGGDWISLALIDGYQVPAAVGTLCFAVFLSAMTLGRWFGPALLDRFGRVAVVRTLAVIAFGGLALFVYGAWVEAAFLGAVLWGAGTSLGFPVGMSAAADQPAAAAGRVSVVASVGYCAFLGGPPLIGFLGSHVGVLHSLVAVGVLLAVAVLLAAAMHPLPSTPNQEESSAEIPTPRLRA
ncbi:MAG TPA: MFS transporter, partial [Micromonosporaceae bacterium]